MMRKRLLSIFGIFTGFALGSALLASCSSSSIGHAGEANAGSAGVLAGGSSASGTAGHSGSAAQGGGDAKGGGAADAKGGADAQGGNDESSAAAAGMPEAGS